VLVPRYYQHFCLQEHRSCQDALQKPDNSIKGKRPLSSAPTADETSEVKHIGDALVAERDHFYIGKGLPGQYLPHSHLKSAAGSAKAVLPGGPRHLRGGYSVVLRNRLQQFHDHRAQIAVDTARTAGQVPIDAARLPAALQIGQNQV
jgi:hypothetical protein